MEYELEESSGLKEVPASEILAKIEKGEPVEYDHVRILGDLDISKLILPKKHIDRTDPEINSFGLEEKINIISSVIKITHSEIRGVCVFSEVAFEKEVDFSGSHFSEYVDFCGSLFIFTDGGFSESLFSGYANFSASHFNCWADFRGSRFIKEADFQLSLVLGMADFSESEFNGTADFLRCKFEFDVDFREAKFNEKVDFIGCEFSRDAYFSGCEFSRKIEFAGSQFNGDSLSFKYSKFSDPVSQEEACRRAKNVMERNGDRQEAGYYFYREMEAKRRQKPWYVRYPEFFFIQLIFGYGVHPFRLMFCWFAVATVFAFIYSAEGGIISKLPASSLPQPLSYFVECFYFSIVTAVTPGYGKYELTSWVYQVIASVEAIFGTFMWAAFIATFARKYMR